MADKTKERLAPPQSETTEPALSALLDRLEPARLSTPVTQDYITADTPMGANLIAYGATFRVWAPSKAITVYVRVSERPDVINGPDDHWLPSEERRLLRNDDGTWTGFISGVQDGDYYRFYIANRGEQPYKRDPYARELAFYGYPDCDCIVRDPNNYPWHDDDYRTPPFNDLIIYQFHIGRFYAVDESGADQRQHRVGNFLDILDQIPHLVELGVNTIEPLPIVELQGPYSLGYNGTDIFSPEMEYGVQAYELPPYLKKANDLLAQRGCRSLMQQQLESQINQLKVVVDICHLYGISVILDVVYNHAGHFGDGDQSIYFFDRSVSGNNNESLYFTDQGWAGGLVFAYWKDEVRQFLIDNAVFFLDEYHIDGLRYDEVTVIDQYGGWRFLQDLTGTMKYAKPQAIHIAEYWRDNPSWVIKDTKQNGAGFDAVWYPGLRTSVRKVIAQAAQGAHAHVDLHALRNSLYKPYDFSAAWRAVQYLENHDRQRYENTNDREPRIPVLADATNTRSWHARSRSRVANGLLLTAPGIPMLFMGQEILEDKYWSDAPKPDTFIWWDGLKQDRHMRDFYRYMGDLVKLRRRHPALRGEGINVFHVHDGNRIIAFQRWQEGVGRDVVVVVCLKESAFDSYELGFPLYGEWLEVFNSDAYDHWGNHNAVGNANRIHVAGQAMHGLAYSCNIIIPANSMLVFARDAGDPL